MILSEAFWPGYKNGSLSYSELFYKYQDYDYIRNGDEKIAVYSSQAGVFGYLPLSILQNSAIYSTRDALIMYRKGKAGTLFTPMHEKWTCSEDAVPLLLKHEFRGRLNPKAIMFLIQDKVFDKVTGKANNATANWDLVKGIEFEYTDAALGQYLEIEKMKVKCTKFLHVIDIQLKKAVKVKGEKIKVGDIFNVTSGVRITESQVYSNPGNLPCVTSQTTKEGITWKADESWLQSFHKNKKQVIVNSPCLTWAKDGNAGKLFYRNYKFFPNDHCGILLPKNEDVNIKWFMYALQPFVYDYVTSQQSQGMLYEEQMANISLFNPGDLILEKAISDEYERLIKLRRILESLNSQLDAQLLKRVS